MNDKIPESPSVIIEEKDEEKDEEKEVFKIQSSFFSKLEKFFKKYFYEGQSESNEVSFIYDDDNPENFSVLNDCMTRHQKMFAILIPFSFFQIIWWILAFKHNYFSYFPDRYLLTITMIFGSIIGGMTAEGGGAVAFPVMTLALGISSSIARDFSLMIQSCGMTSASFTILYLKVPLEWNSIIFCGIGSSFGIIFGLEIIDPILDSRTKKLSFVSIWFSFAFALYLLNREYKRQTFDKIIYLNFWKIILLLLFGFIGGIFSAIAGSGVDICSFSLLTLFFRVSEKIATPSSVLLMSLNTMIGFFWRGLMSSPGIEEESWKFLAVCVPVSVVFGPLGSLFSTYFHRQVLAFSIYILDTLALVTALIVIPMTWQRSLLVVILLIGGFLFFFVLSFAGKKLMIHSENKKDRNLG